MKVSGSITQLGVSGSITHNGYDAVDVIPDNALIDYDGTPAVDDDGTYIYTS